MFRFKLVNHRLGQVAAPARQSQIRLDRLGLRLLPPPLVGLRSIANAFRCA